MAYTDLTSAFAYRDLVVWSKMDQLAENDAYDHFAAGTRTFFYQVAAPTGWSKLTSQNNKVLRITSGAGGGSGGALGTSSAIDFSHSHTVPHTHTAPAHTHILDYTSDTGARAAFGNQSVNDGDKITAYGGGAASLRGPHRINFLTATPSDTASTASGTDTQSTTFSLAYADVIACEKS